MRPRQGTLFDEEMRATAERATLWADALRQQLTDAEAHITALERERDALRQRVAALERELRDAALLQRVREAYGLAVPYEGDQGRLVKALTRLAASCHPDKWGGSAIAEEITNEILALRDSFMQ